MCNIGAAIQVASLVQGYREKKAINKGIRRDQDESRKNFDRGYLHDINKIDQEKVNADREKKKAEIKSKFEKNAQTSELMNLGAGNNVKIVQSIGYLFDQDWVEITSEYDKDVQTFQNQQTEAYANLHKGYNSLTPPVDPSRTGLMLEIGATTYDAYQNNQNNKGAKKNP